MDVNPRLFSGEEEQSELAVTDDGWSHVRTVAHGLMAVRGSAASWLFSPRRKALTLVANHSAVLRCLTFELTGRQRDDASARLAKMYRVPPAGRWWHAVGAPVERGVRRHRARRDVRKT